MPGTPVLLADGTTLPIQDIELGDLVVATDPETGEQFGRPVTALITGDGTKHLVEITIDTDGPTGDNTASVTATDGHPFWVADEGRWVDASRLQAGDWLLTDTGERRLVASIRAWTAEHQQVHNLTIYGTHTYHVSAADGAQLLTHNTKPGCGDSGATGDAVEPLDSARAARDDLAAEVGSNKATVTGGYDSTTGRVAAGCNSNPTGCAEDDVVRQLGVPADQVRFTEAIRPRTGAPLPVCLRFQGQYSRSQFPPGTRFQQG